MVPWRGQNRREWRVENGRLVRKLKKQCHTGDDEVWIRKEKRQDHRWQACPWMAPLLGTESTPTLVQVPSPGSRCSWQLRAWKAWDRKCVCGRKKRQNRVCMLSHFSLALCDPMDCSLPASSVHGILQARILEWVAISFSRESSWPRDWTHISYVSCIGRRILERTHLYAMCQVLAAGTNRMIMGKEEVIFELWVPPFAFPDPLSTFLHFALWPALQEAELYGPQWAARPWHLAVYQRARGDRGQSIDPLHFQKLTLS